MHRGWRLGLAGIAAAAAAAVSFACETPTSAPAEPSPPRDPNGCMYNDRYYANADYPDGFLDEQGCNRCGCGNERAPRGCQMLPCDVEQATAAKRAGPSRLSLDKVSCKVVAERLVLEDDKRGWTMFIDGKCHDVTLRMIVRGSVALGYPQLCRESASADATLSIDGSTRNLSGRNANARCEIVSGPMASQPAEAQWPTFLAVVSETDDREAHTIAYRPLVASPAVDTDTSRDGGVSPPNP